MAAQFIARVGGVHPGSDVADRIPTSWHYNSDKSDTDRNLNDEEETTVSDEESTKAVVPHSHRNSSASAPDPAAPSPT